MPVFAMRVLLVTCSTEGAGITSCLINGTQTVGCVVNLGERGLCQARGKCPIASEEKLVLRPEAVLGFAQDAGLWVIGPQGVAGGGYCSQGNYPLRGQARTLASFSRGFLDYGGKSKVEWLLDSRAVPR